MQSLQLSILSNSRELSCYHYFWNQVLPVLPGHYDHLFWGIWIRQACFVEPSIQHAMVAAGALHESVALSCAGHSDQAAQQRTFSIQQYNKTISSLTDSNTPETGVQNVLTCCILFIMFENLYGRNLEAAKHLKSGLAILQSWEPQTASEEMVKSEYLIPIYTRGYDSVGSEISLPATFENITEARKTLQILLDTMYSAINRSFLSSGQSAIEADIAHARRTLRQWFAAFLMVRTPKDLEHRRASILLRLQYETSNVLLAAVQSHNECDFDTLTETFRVIVDQCSELITLENSLRGQATRGESTFSYGFDLNIIPPLNITAIKCRDPTLRRKAIALLSDGNRYEGLWNGKTVSRIAQKTMELEEAGLACVSICTDIPRQNRVRLNRLLYCPGSVFPSQT